MTGEKPIKYMFLAAVLISGLSASLRAMPARASAMGGCSGRCSIPIAGATASEANTEIRIPLGSGDEHVTIAPLQADVPFNLFIQYDDARQAWFISSKGDLTLRSLKLNGDAIVRAGGGLNMLEGQLYVSGNLSLLAGRAISIRDSATHPVVIRAWEDLTLQGDQTLDIFALHHPESALISGGDMTLRSENPVRGDAHYFVGGRFDIKGSDGSVGDLLSPYDPVILANGDVSLGHYTGASLHILAGGGVILNSATITETGTIKNTLSPANGHSFNGSTTIGSLASFSLSDGTLLNVDGSITPTLDIRAGIDWAALGGPPVPMNQIIPSGVVTPSFGTASSAAITITGAITISQPGGLVLLTNQYQPNDVLTGGISTGDISTWTNALSSDGGAITIDSRAGISTGALASYAEDTGPGVTPGDGGAVRLLASEGEVFIGGDILSYSRASPSGGGFAGSGGSATIQALNGGIVIGNVFAYSNVSVINGVAQDGGNITLLAGNGGVAFGHLSNYSQAGGPNSAVGNGGSTTVTAANGGITFRERDEISILSHAQSYLNNGDSGVAGSGGDVTLQATQNIDLIGGILTFAVSPGASGSAVDGGNIVITSTNGSVLIDGLL